MLNDQLVHTIFYYMKRGLLDLHAVLTHSKSQKVKRGKLTSIYYVAHLTWHMSRIHTLGKDSKQTLK